MNDRPIAPPTQLAQTGAAEAPPQAEENARRDEEEELDKYDLSTLACTD